MVFGKKFGAAIPLAIAACLAAASLAASRASAEDAPSGIKIEKPWARASAGKSGAAYFTVTNAGAAPDRLVAAEAPVAGVAALELTATANGIMTMRPLGPVTLAPGQSLTLKPGAEHLMLTGLKAPLKAGDSFPLTLIFEKAGPVTVTVTVEKAGAKGMNAGGMHQMPGMTME